MLCLLLDWVESRVSQLHNNNNNSKQASDTIAWSSNGINRAKPMHGATHLNRSKPRLRIFILYCRCMFAATAESFRSTVVLPSM